MQRLKKMMVGVFSPLSLYFVLSELLQARWVVSFVIGVFGVQTLHSLDIESRFSTRLKLHTSSAQVEVIPAKFYRFTENISAFGSLDLSFANKLEQSKLEVQILKTIPGPLAKNAKKYVRAVLLLSEKHQVDPLWILSVMWTESHFFDGARSHVGARGLMQIMPLTKIYLIERLARKQRKLVIQENNFEIQNYFSEPVIDNEYQIHLDRLKNIELGIIYLKRLLYRFNQNPSFATVAYNMGPTWTRSRLNRGLPVGNRNEYLKKVNRAYAHIQTRI